jgi:hypothetical protein
MKTIQKIREFALAAALCIVGAATSQAQGISVLVNGDPIRFAGMGPQRIEGRVLVPLRGVLEKIGAHVGWVPSSQTVVASRGNMDLQLKIGSRKAQVNGREVMLDVPATMIAGTTMVPLRFVGETLGADVGWNEATQTVAITTQGNSGNPGNSGNQTQPPPDRPGRTDRALAIASLTHNKVNNWLAQGETLTVTMEGTPGGQASFRMPGVHVQMNEASPGVYRGQWTPTKNREIFTRGVALVGHLTLNGRNAPEMQAAQKVMIDTVPPRISNLTPPPNSRVTTRQPLISAAYSDAKESGVALDRIRVKLDDRIITDDGTLSNRDFTFHPTTALTVDRHTVEFVVHDKAGNATTRRWTFDVTATTGAIQSVNTNAKEALEPGDVLNVRMTGAPGGKASFEFGGIKNRSMTEEQSGVYVGSYTIRKTDAIADSPIIVRLTTREGETFTSSTDRQVEVALGPPAAPKIVSPKEGEAIPNPLVVRGTATPNSTVRLKVDYAEPVLGGALALRGTAAQVDIPVDKNGRWTSEPLDISSRFGSKDTKYTLTAVAVNKDEEESTPISLRLTRR